MSNNIDPTYRKQIEQIRLDSEAYAKKQMVDIYSDQNDKLDEIHIFIGLFFIKYATDGFLKLTDALKAKIMKQVDTKLNSIGKNLGNREVSKVSDILKNVYKDTYYKNAYILDSGLDVNLKFNILKQQFIDNAINAEFSGETFSDRIWANKNEMMKQLKQLIINAANGDTTVDQIGRQIKERFGVSAFQSKRLVETEVARHASQAQLQIGQDAGCKKVMWSATLEGNTCDDCAALDGKLWDIGDAPNCPEHPLCRCCLINVPPTGWEPSVRKDNETKDIIDYQSFNQWSRDNGIN